MAENVPCRRGSGSRQMKQMPPRRSDFSFGRTLGEGSYARVVYCTSKLDTSQEFAMKIMRKSLIKKEDKIRHVMLERQLLTELSSPYIINLVLSFHDIDNLYICMEYAAGGDLLQYINAHHPQKPGGVRTVDQDSSWKVITQFYVAEIVDALEYIHGEGVVHRDLKPDNVLLTSTGHIKLGDFGSALIVRDIPVEDAAEDGQSPHEDEGREGYRRNDSTVHSFVGTSEYVSPEVLRDQQASSASDYWALGCIIFKMETFHSPFVDSSEFFTFKKILAHADGADPSPIEYPDAMDTHTRNLIGCLLRGPPGRRLGSRGSGGRWYGGVGEKGGKRTDCICSKPQTSPSSTPPSITSATDLGASGLSSTSSANTEMIRTEISIPADISIDVSGSIGTGGSGETEGQSGQIRGATVGEIGGDSTELNPTELISSGLVLGSEEDGDEEVQVDIKAHIFFSGIQWGKLLETPAPVPFWPLNSGVSPLGGDIYDEFTYMSVLSGGKRGSSDSLAVMAAQDAP